MSMPAVDSFLRVQALGDVAHRYAAIVLGLSNTVAAALPALEGDTRQLLSEALADADAQLAAAGDMLERALADLPEGHA